MKKLHLIKQHRYLGRRILENTNKSNIPLLGLEMAIICYRCTFLTANPLPCPNKLSLLTKQLATFTVDRSDG